MRARGWVILALIGGLVSATSRAAPREPKPLVIDIKEFKDRLVVATDPSGGTYVMLRDDKDRRAWYGTGKILYEQAVIGGTADGDAWMMDIWAPRLAEIRSGTLEKRKDGTYFKGCDGQDDTVLTQLTGDKAKAVLDASTFMSSGAVRRPHSLSRDDTGTYYYIDKLSQLHGGKGYRVFVGRKGAMKLLALTDAATDSAGEVFSTKSGDLRLVYTKDSARRKTTWIKRGKKIELFDLDLDVNSPVIFKDLGIYKFMGTICDNI